jgi:ribonuclease BN (tRNA processing enzyme)
MAHAYDPGMRDTSLELFVAGAGPSYTDRPGATGAAYLVRHGSTAILLDLGQGSFPRVAGELDATELDAVVVSHLHPDHFVDLVALRHYLCYGVHPPRRLTVLSPAGLADRLDGLHAEPGFTAAALDCLDLSEGSRSVGELQLDVRLVTHAAESYAFRVAASGGGHGLVYSGDCGRAADLAPLIKPGDTLLCEVSFGPGPVPLGVNHLDGPAVGELAATAGAGRVLLTHLQMGYGDAATIESVRTHFEGPVELVQPGSRFRI